MTDLLLHPCDDDGQLPAAVADCKGASAFLWAVAAEVNGHDTWSAVCPGCAGEAELYLVDDLLVSTEPTLRSRCLDGSCVSWPQGQLDQLAFDVVSPQFANNPLTDVGRARILRDHLARQGKVVRYCADLKNAGWYLWDDGRWHQNAEAAIAAQAHSLGDAFLDEAERVDAERVALDDEASPDKSHQLAEMRQMIGLLKHAATKAHGTAGISNALTELARLDGVTVDVDAWNKNRDLLGVANGVLNLKTGELMANQPEMMVTRHISTVFDPDAEAPLWERTLSEILPADDASWLQKFLGYGITGHTKEQKMLLIYGSGANGKSTVTDVLETVLDKIVRTPSMDAFMAAPATSGASPATPQIADLRNARLALASESDSADVLKASLIKRATGDKTLSARYQYGNDFTFTSMFKIVLSTNHKPQVRDNGEGIWRRIMVLKFGKFIAPEDRDHELVPKLEAEASGILNWLVAGALRWRVEQLGTTPNIQAETLAYRESSDTLAEYLMERVVFAEGLEVNATELITDYASWAEANKVGFMLGRNRFNQEIAQRPGVVKGRKENAVVFAGIGLVEAGRVAGLNPIGGRS